jgi:hypothetical protein
MIGKIKAIIKENYQLHNRTQRHLKELEWAHIFHDSIRGKPWLEKLDLNIGRWAGNYPFFYVLNRILNDYKPNKILEFGLGESSKFISTYIENKLHHTNHQIIEQSEDWLSTFSERFTLCTNSKVKVCPLGVKQINGYDVNCYNGIQSLTNEKYDLYIIDGPFGSSHFSRYDVMGFIETLNQNDEFIILLDDTHRDGEIETLMEVKNKLKTKGLVFYENEFTGNKSFHVIATEKYKYIISV